MIWREGKGGKVKYRTKSNEYTTQTGDMSKASEGRVSVRDLRKVLDMQQVGTEEMKDTVIKETENDKLKKNKNKNKKREKKGKEKMFAWCFT